MAKEMKYYTVTLVTTIEAKSLKEANALADNLSVVDHDAEIHDSTPTVTADAPNIDGMEEDDARDAMDAHRNASTDILDREDFGAFTIQIQTTDQCEGGYMYDVWTGHASDIGDGEDSADGGQCTGTFKDALSMAEDAARKLYTNKK